MPDTLVENLALVGLLVTGRTILSLLPPGEPGAQRLGPFPVTWAAAWTIGIHIWVVVARLVDVLLVDHAAQPGVSTKEAFQHPWTIGVLCLSLPLAGLRSATLPGSMVPRHDVPETPMSHAGTAMVIAAWVLVVVDMVSGDWALGQRRTAWSLAWIGMTLHALRTMRVRADARAAFGLVLVGILAWGRIPWSIEGLHLDPAMSAIVMGGLLWTRRADRRGRALVGALLVLALASGSLSVASALGLASGLVLATASPARRRVAIHLGLAIVVGVAIGAIAPWNETVPIDPIPSRALMGIGVTLVGAATAAAVRWRPLDRPRREALWMLGAPSFVLAGNGLAQIGLPISGDLESAGPIVLAFALVAVPVALLPRDPLACGSNGDVA